MRTPIDEYVIDRVREKRTELGVSQTELADLINISRGFIGNIESGKSYKYNFRHINEIAKVLKCSPKDFLPEHPL
ncbi:MAG: helix-turn-helix domain-containing protein [Tannerellaceae bacterium]|nr:helix-turn-helix domain-containing protein [Tannerellaceae bacterium]